MYGLTDHDLRGMLCDRIYDLREHMHIRADNITKQRGFERIERLALRAVAKKRYRARRALRQLDWKSNLWAVRHHWVGMVNHLARIKGKEERAVVRAIVESAKNHFLNLLEYEEDQVRWKLKNAGNAFPDDYRREERIALRIKTCEKQLELFAFYRKQIEDRMTKEDQKSRRINGKWLAAGA